MFQSTPLCEGRRCLFVAVASSYLGFNPRPCVRGDDAVKNGGVMPIQVSIHAPV